VGDSERVEFTTDCMSWALLLGLLFACLLPSLVKLVVKIRKKKFTDYDY